MATTSKYLFVLALAIGILALFWPHIEEFVFQKCPFTVFGTRRPHATTASGYVETHSEPNHVRVYTLAELRAYDGSDEMKPILMSVGGKVLDVSSGAKFYKKGASYNMFAGTVSFSFIVVVDKSNKTKRRW
jgi:membrane-associated progesterone receptor component